MIIYIKHNIGYINSDKYWKYILHFVNNIENDLKKLAIKLTDTTEISNIKSKYQEVIIDTFVLQTIPELQLYDYVFFSNIQTCLNHDRKN